MMRKRKRIVPIESDSDDPYSFQAVEQHEKIKENTIVSEFFNETEVEVSQFYQSKFLSCIGESNTNHDSLEDIAKYTYFHRSEVPEQCVKILKEQKADEYQQILVILSRMIQDKTARKLLFVFGQQQIGKKTLIFESLENIKDKINYNLTVFYLNFDERVQQNKIKCKSLLKYLSQKDQHFRKQDDQKDIFVINNYSAFFSIVKKLQFHHKLKFLILRNSNVFVFVDRNRQILKKYNFIEEKSIIMEMTRCRHETIAKILVEIIGKQTFLNTRWNISKPLSLFLCSKISENQMNFSLIEKMKVFLTKYTQNCSIDQDLLPESIILKKIERQMLEQFKQEFLNQTHNINIQNLNIHLKLTLLSLFLVINQREVIAVQYSQLFKRYQWACESLSLKNRTEKEFSKQIISELQTYKLVKTLKRYLNLPRPHIVLNISVNQIAEKLGQDSTFSKFFNNID